MEWKEFSAKTVEEARENAARECGVSEDELEVEVIEAESTSFLGIKKNNAIILARKRSTENLADTAREMLSFILKFIVAEANIEVREREHEVYLNVICEDSGILIGKDGNTLNALQFLIGRMISRGKPAEKIISIDVGGYREKRKKNLEKVVDTLTQKALKIQKPVIVNTSNIFDRWLIHTMLSNHGKVYTKSIGEGRNRELYIIPNELKGQEEELLKNHAPLS